MRWLIVVTLALVSACAPSEAPPSTRYTRENVGFDVTRDAAVNGQYIASGTYVDGQGVNPDEVKWRALLNGMEAARKDGYDLVVWSNVGTGTASQTLAYLTTRGTSQSYTQFRGFTYVVRGYKSTGDHPSAARPVASLIEQINGELAKRKV
jgi:hypothetical protein